MDIYEHLNTLVDSGCTKQSTDIRVALGSFPDLKAYEHLGSVMLITKEVNAFCDRVFLEWDPEGKLMARPHILDKGVVLHSSPAVIYVGKQNPDGFGVVPYPTWESVFQRWDISAEAEYIVWKYLQSRPPVNY